MSHAEIWVLSVVFLTLTLLVMEWLPAGVIGVLAMGSLILGHELLGGVMPSTEVVLGALTQKAVIAVAAMFVLSAGVSRTGAVGLVANRLVTDSDSGVRHMMTAIFGIVLVASAFVNNTPIVLIFMPVVLGLSNRLGKAPSKLLIPLSFISIMGGMCTLVGTSTNLVVASSVSESSGGTMTLGLFDFARMGLILAVVGVVYLRLFASRLLPTRTSLGLNLEMGVAAEYMTELQVKEGSRLVGKTVGDGFRKAKSLRVLQIIRNDIIRPALPSEVLKAGDRLLVKGDPASIMGFHQGQDTGVLPAITEDAVAQAAQEAPRSVALTLAEVVLTPASRWIGRRTKEIRFHERYRVSIFAVQRHGAHLREKVEDLKLRSGDILLVQGSPEDLANIRSSDNLLVIEGVHRGIPHTRRAPLAVLGLVVFLVMAMIDPAAVHIAALTAALIVVVGGALTAREAYASMDWDVLFLLGGTLALGGAVASTGLAERMAGSIVSTCGAYGETVTIGVIFLVTVLLTQILSNIAAAAIMTPLAYATALAMWHETSTGVMPTNEPLALVMAVAFGASCCFLTPVGYQTNLLVYGPGGYRFTDFLKIGLPLTLLFAALATWLLPILY